MFMTAAYIVWLAFLFIDKHAKHNNFCTVGNFYIGCVYFCKKKTEYITTADSTTVWGMKGFGYY